MDKKKILITYIESGMGHITSARSIADALKKNYSNSFDIIECDIMKHDEASKRFETFMTNQVKATNKVRGYGFFIFGLLELLGGQKFMRLAHKTLFRKACDAVIEVMRSYNPDILVSTHHLITYCAIELKKRYMPNLQIITYNPDNNVHCWWDSRDGLFILNNEFANIEAKHRKFKDANIRNVHFTARECLLNNLQSKEYYRDKYGIPRDKFAVIVADGAYAAGKSKKVTDKLLKTKLPLTIVMLAGHNDEVYNYFASKKVPDNITLIPLHFTKDAFEYYRACDLFITKGGPNAILDSMYMNTPVIVNYYPQPMEKAAKVLFVDKLKCGEYISSPRKIRKRVEQFIQDPSLLDEYRNNTTAFNTMPNGADEIADIIYHQTFKDTDNAN